MLLKSFFFLVAFCSSIYSQFLIEEIYTVIPHENKVAEVLDISNTGNAIVKETEGDIENYYIVDLMNTPQQKQLFISLPVRVNVWFSENSRFLVFSLKSGNKFVLQIYDTLDKTIKQIDDSTGDVAYASIINKNNILYEVRPPQDYPKLYMLSEEFSNPKIIGDGMTPLWSPDGQWFLAKKSDYDKQNLNDKVSKAFGYRITAKPIYSIYNSDGQKILDIKNHDDVFYINWASLANKIVLKEFNEGFCILYLKSVNNKLEIGKEYFFSGFEKEGGNVAIADNPVWSPDGNWISLIKAVEDGHSTFEHALYIFNPNSEEIHKIVSYYDKIIKKTTWISNNQLLILMSSSDDRNEMVVNRISLESLIK